MHIYVALLVYLKAYIKKISSLTTHNTTTTHSVADLVHQVNLCSSQLDNAERRVMLSFIYHSFHYYSASHSTTLPVVKGLMLESKLKSSKYCLKNSTSGDKIV